MIQYEIHGDNLEVVRVRLEPGDEIIAEAGKMIFKTSAVDWRTTMHGKELAGSSSEGLSES